MSDFFREYFTDSYTRNVDGYLSFIHLFLVIVALIIAFSLAIYCAKKTQDKNKPLKIVAIMLLIGQAIKFLCCYLEFGNFKFILDNLPLYLCNLQLLTIPFVAFSHSKLKNPFYDFIFAYGMLGAITGTLFAAGIYNIHPALHFKPLISLYTHACIGFAGLYVYKAKLTSFKKESIKVITNMLVIFMGLAYFVNYLQHGANNYMYLYNSEGTPFQILYNLFSGNKIFYGFSIMILQYLYFIVFFKLFNKNKDY